METTRLLGWARGLNTRKDPAELAADELRQCVNFDILRNGHLRRRPGRTSLYQGSIASGTFWADGEHGYFVESGTLKRITEGGVASTLRSGMSGNPVAYVKVNGDVYYSDGTVTGQVRGGLDRSWGVEMVRTPPNLRAISGSLAAGTYQVAQTLLRDDGEEGGCALTASIELEAGSGIEVTPTYVPAAADVKRMAVYVSAANGDVLYLHSERPVGTMVLTSTSDLGAPLATQFMSPPPAAEHLAYLNGRIAMAKANLLWLTEPLRYGAVRLRDSWFRFPANITVLAATTDGLYVAADVHYWLSVDGETPRRLAKMSYGAPIGRPVSLPDGVSVAWVSKRGIEVGGPGGEVKALTEAVIDLPDCTSACIGYRQGSGLKQLIAVIR